MSRLLRLFIAFTCVTLILTAPLPAQTGIITTVAGTGVAGTAGVGGPAANAQIVPAGICVDSADNMYIADPASNRVLRVDASSGTLTLVAGNGTAGSSGDNGLATQASLNAPRGVAVDRAGNLFIVEFQGNRVRRVDAGTGIITTFAGTGSSGFSGDGGPAVNATLYLPFAITFDSAGYLYIADAGNARVRQVDPVLGTITTVAGNGTNVSAPDGYMAISSGFPVPFGIGFDHAGELLISEYGNARIRRVELFTGVITTAVGNGAYGFTGDGVTALSAGIGKMFSNVVSDTAGNLFFPDGAGRIRRVDASTGIITTVAGNGSGAQGQAASGGGGGGSACYPTVAGDNGPATNATLDGPYGVALTSNGNLLISDAMDCRVRRVFLPSPFPYTNTVLSAPTISPGQPATLTATVTPIAAGGTPTGTVQFVYEPAPSSPVVLGSASLFNGIAQLTVSGPTSVGNYTIYGYYSGDSVFNGSGSPPSAIIVKSLATPTVTLTASQTQTTVNTNVTFTVTVAAPPGNSNVPTGQVQLRFSGSMPTQTSTLTNGSVQFNVPFSNVGSYSIYAAYYGDNNFAPWASSTLTETVKAASSVTLTSDSNPSILGTTVNFTATVTPAQATGTVRFSDGATTLGTATVTNGVATLAVPSLATGSHSLQAAYSGDGSYTSSNSAALSQTVTNTPTVTITANPASPTYGQTVTFAVTIAPAAATGSVSLSTDPTDTFGIWGSFPLSGGSAVIPISGIYSGTHNITATYSGDSVYTSAASAPVTIIVAKATPAVTLVSASNPSMQGQYLALTATVSPTSNATTTVQFFDGTTLIGSSTVSNAPNPGTATYNAWLGAGHHSLTAVSNSNRDLNTASSPAIDQTVQTNTVVNLQSPGPFIYGQPITLTASLSSPNATGTVQFSDGGTLLGTVTITNPPPSITASTLTGGPHTITAAYSGDGIFLPATGSLSITVNKAPTTTNLTSSANPSNSGQSVTFTAAVSPAAATGTVQFLDGTTVLGTAAISSGTATFIPSSLAAGGRSMTAVYSGDGNYATSTSAALTQVVKTGTATSVSSSANPSITGQSIILIATLSASATTGTVQFSDGATVIGTVTVSGGSATLSTSALTAGSHTLTASYSGDTYYSASSSSLTQTVKAQTSTALSSSSTTLMAGRAVTFTASVTPAVATGTVQFLDSATVLGTSPVSGGSATLSVSTLSVGAHSLTAVYSGDANDTGSTSTAVSVTVSKAATSTALSASSTASTLEQNVTFTASITPAVATGTVQFLDGTTVLATTNVGNGSAAFSTSGLGVGSHSITAVYSGDGNDSGSTSTAVSVTIGKISSTTALSASSTTLTLGQSVTFTASVTPAAATGSVQFLDGATMLATASVANGSVTFSTSSLAVGSRSITAVYNGDGNDAGSSSAAVTVTVIKLNTATALTSSLNPAISGQHVTFTATVSPASATGTVKFLDGSTVLGTISLNGGSAAFSALSLAVGSHSITAVYGGDGNGTGSTSKALTEIVNAPPPRAPSNLTANAANSNTINLTWAASPTWGVTYNVYSSANAVFTPSASNRIASGLTNTSYSNTGLSPGTTRYYLVTAQNANGESVASNEASAITKGGRH